MTSKQDRLDYIELAARDMDAMKAFYGMVFGWEFTDFGPGYTSFKLGHLDGGFSTERQVAALGQGPLPIFYARDIEATEALVRSHGGRVTTALFDFPGGRRFHFTDPSGNELAVWTDPD